MNWKPGTKLKCIRGDGMDLTDGKTYTIDYIKKLEPRNEFRVAVLGVPGREWIPDRFVVVERKPKNLPEWW
jgi:hypothetical protein